jgi:MoaA/NifB/PqqE/SkfB family radical SAM enzyme
MKLKQVANVLAYAVGKKEPVAGPMKLGIEVTQRCNSKCKSCDRWYNFSRVELATEEYKKLLSDVRSMGTSTVSLTGGEALLRKDLFELIQHGKEIGLYVTMNSNGILINERFSKKIVESGVEIISFSLDGSKAEIHDEIRGVKGNYDKVINAVKNIRRYRKKKPLISLNMTINGMNKHDIINTAKLTKEIGADGFTIQPIHQTKGMGFMIDENQKLRPEDYDKIDEQIRTALKRYPEMFIHSKDYSMEIKTFLKNPKLLYKFKCVAGYLLADVYPNGDVFVCPAWGRKIGNLRENSFKEIWWSEMARQTRGLIRDDKHPICWFNCMGSMNLPMYYLKHPTKWPRLFGNANFIKYAIKKLN